MYEVVCDIGDCPKTDTVASIQICNGCPFLHSVVKDKGCVIAYCSFEDN